MSRPLNHNAALASRAEPGAIAAASLQRSRGYLAAAFAHWVKTARATHEDVEAMVAAINDDLRRGMVHAKGAGE